ncbi:uncharacterized protein LOC134842985 isoform X2 [Symsagittifera roscoffensis]|uniref:uncharacterized protein LOC134842985 isoform X2 n=1 Tax=Symsagittifera roscoffensis TaxID=84072 RepID=UPI00307B67CC
MQNSKLDFKGAARAAVVASTTKTSAARRNNAAGAGGTPRQPSDNLLTKLDEKDKARQKYKRILAVILYLISVSMGAIILGIYYSLIWEHTWDVEVVRATNNNSTDSGSNVEVTQVEA